MSIFKMILPVDLILVFWKVPWDFQLSTSFEMRYFIAM